MSNGKSRSQQGIIANDQATVNIGKVEQHFSAPLSESPSPLAMIKILLLSAQPRNLASLRLDEEKRDIEQGLERARDRDRFELIKKEAVRSRDLRRAMLAEEPQIVHFCGHGGGEAGLALEDEGGNLATVSAAALRSLFGLFETVHCVVLNACYSEVQAAAIVQEVPYVVGMNDAIGDRAAIEFAVAFYDALGAGREVPFAFDYACVAIELANRPESHKPVLLRNPTGLERPLATAKK